MKLSLLVFFLFILKSGIPCFGQSPVYYNYSTNEGLPSSETYDILQDSKGYIWIATDRGASRFDGYTFKNFTTAEGLTNNTILRIHEDEKGRIWFLPITAELCYLENNEIKIYSFNSKLKENRTDIITSFHCDEMENIYIGFISKGLLTIDRNGNLRKVNAGQVNHKSYFVNEYEKNIFVSCLGKDATGSDDSIHFTFKNDITNCGFPLAIKSKDQIYITGVKRRNESSVFYFTGYTAEINKEKKISVQETNEEIVRIFEDHNSCLWVGIKGGGVRKYLPGEGLQSENFESYLSEESITCIEEDKENGIWLASLANGIYYFPNPLIKSYSFPAQNNITTLEKSSEENKVYLGFSSGTLLEITAGAGIKEINYNNDKQTYIYSILQSGNYQYVSTSHQIYILKNKIPFLSYKGGYSRHPAIYNGQITGIGHHSIYFIDTTDFTLKRQTPLQVKGEVTYADKNDNLWIGDHSGLYFFKDSTLLKAFPDNKLLDSRVSAIGEMPGNLLIISTIGNGLMLLKPDSSYIHLTENEGLASKVINCMIIDKKEIWLGTNKGISHINTGTDSFSVQNFSVAHGLPGNEILHLEKTGHYIWAATRRELFFFDINKIKLNIHSPEIYVLSAQANRENFFSGINSSVNYDEFPLKILFTGLSYKMRGNVLYKYRLKGLSEEWQYTRTPSVDFLSLPAGEYIFEVAARNEDGTWSKRAAAFSFNVIPPFWKTTWFIILIFVTIIISVILTALFRIRSIKKRNQLMTDLLTYRQQALTMQMNPHFIFNSLNSIQSFIMTEEKKPATKYISKFARLMRRSLENSRNEFILLSEETEVLNLYLELECLRFKNLFSFRIETDPLIDPDKTLIPSMLIQPFVENCVKHAFIGPTEIQGEISIIIKKENEMLICEIEDNGIGIEASLLAHSKGGHISAGLNITENRLKLISKSLGQKFLFSINDKNKRKGKGTIVTFAIPYK